MAAETWIIGIPYADELDDLNGTVMVNGVHWGQGFTPHARWSIRIEDGRVLSMSRVLVSDEVAAVRAYPGLHEQYVQRSGNWDLKQVSESLAGKPHSEGRPDRFALLERLADPAPLDQYTTAQAAERLDISPVRVQQLCRERGVGRKIGHILLLTAEEIESLRERRPVGRPAKQR